jgi:hypothetical protein
MSGTRWSKVHAEFKNTEDNEMITITMLNMTTGRLYTLVIATPQEKGQNDVLDSTAILGALRAATAFYAQAAGAPMPEGIASIKEGDDTDKSRMN